jgi:hypothetical protein
LLWIFFTSQSTLILDPKKMLNLELVCDTLNRIFGVVEYYSKCLEKVESSPNLDPGSLGECFGVEGVDELLT